MSINKDRKPGGEFYVIKKDNGIVVLIPKVEDYFAEAADEAYYMPEEDVGYTSAKGELDEI